MSSIQFIEETHKYVTDEGKELISVSAFTDLFKEKVDWRKKAEGVAKRLTKEGTPTTTQDILFKWENKRNISADVGTILHNMHENELLRNGKTDIFGKEYPVYQFPKYTGNKKSIPIHSLENNMVYPELMIYDVNSMICGQSDLVSIIDDHIHIYDYKTDQEIKFVGYSSKWESAKCYLPPISHLEECNGNTYSLKMSLYMYMLWKANKGRFKIGDIVIIHKHLKRDDDGIPILENSLPVVLKEERIQLPYRKKEVIEMLKQYNDTKNT